MIDFCKLSISGDIDTWLRIYFSILWAFYLFNLENNMLSNWKMVVT